jgi:excinuclease ABC subunit C
MERRSEALEFEKAAKILDTIRYIERTIETQYVDRPLGHDVDALGLHRHAEDVVLSLLNFREGRLTGSRHFSFGKIGEEDEELLSTFLLQHYDERLVGEAPPEILLPFKIPDQEIVEELISACVKRKVVLHVPMRGDKKALAEMARVNAEAYYQSQKNEADFNEQLLLEMEELFDLGNYPATIECFDTSNTAGSEPVASMITFKDGKKDGAQYRIYRLHTEGKPDDYGGMEEVLTRRYKRARDENTLPDLVIVDGGKGQLNVALKVMDALNVTGIDVIGLAKQEGRHDKGMTEEQVYLPGRKEPILLKKNSPVLYLLQKMRDEAHRVAINFHRKRRSKKTLGSALDGISGIGPAKRKALLSHFGSVKNIKEATEEELRAVKGITKTNARMIILGLK